MLLTDAIITEYLHAFTFPGGGFKGAGQIGFIQRMLELGIEPSMTFGTSVGTLHAGFCAMRKYDLLYKLWDEVGKTNGAIITKAYLGKIVDGSVVPDIDKIEEVLTRHITLGNKIGLVTAAGRRKVIKKIAANFQEIDKVMDNAPLHELLKEHVRMADFKCDFWFTFVSLHDNQLYKASHRMFKDDKNLQLGMLASTGMPGVWAPVPKIEMADGTVIRDCVDGGLRMSSPVSLAFQKINKDMPWKVWVPNLNAEQQPKNEAKKGLIVQAGSSIDIMLNNNITRDIKDSEKWNDVALKCPEYAAENGLIHAQLYNILAPVDEFGNSLFGRTLDPSPEMIAKRIKLGYESVNQYFPNLAK